VIRRLVGHKRNDTKTKGGRGEHKRGRKVERGSPGREGSQTEKRNHGIDKVRSKIYSGNDQHGTFSPKELVNKTKPKSKSKKRKHPGGRLVE